MEVDKELGLMAVLPGNSRNSCTVVLEAGNGKLANFGQIVPTTQSHCLPRIAVLFEFDSFTGFEWPTL